jgi:SNF2 family DNA or RNA helicase
MEMGTGKTLTAMAIANRLNVEKDCKKILIICPKVAMPVWRDEYKKFENLDYKLRLITGTQKKRVDAMNELVDDPSDNLNIAVINYEYTYAFESILSVWKPDIIICDESHRIKGVTTNQTKAITKIGKLVKYKLCLTGTPLTNNILDFFSQFRFLDTSVFGLNFYSFKNRYVITGMFGEYLRPNKSTFDEFKGRVAKISYRVTKEQCLQLPEFTDVVVPVDIDCMKMYRELEKDYITWLNETEYISVENALTKTLKLRQITSGFYYNVDEQGNKDAVFVDDAKIKACMELIEELVENDKKVIVFAEFQAEIEKIKELCDREKIKSGTYYGKTPEKKKLEVVDNFQNGDLQVFIGQIESAGISITLTSASHMIFLSTGYKYGVYDQARARIHRKGQVNKCTYYHLIANNTIDAKIMKALENKEALAQSVIDDYKNKK